MKTWKYFLILFTVIVVLIIAIRVGYEYNWTGFSSYTSPDGEYFREKTLWDWAELLIVPVFLGGLAIWFKYYNSRVSREANLDQYRETALLKYFDDVADLIKNNDLLTSSNDPYLPERFVAWQKTVAITRMVDTSRKKLLLDFLYYSDLIYNNTGSTKNLINLHNADFSGVDYKNSHLTNASLRGVIFYGADLSGTHFVDADLSDADLRNARLVNANLRNANLSNVDLTKTKLRNADLQLANLRNAKITEKQLSHLVGLAGAIMPKGEIYDGQYEYDKDIHDAKGCEVNTKDKNALAKWYKSAREEMSYYL
jgi:uncharacterized membrane protein YciS (DUF1049 family)